MERCRSNCPRVIFCNRKQFRPAATSTCVSLRPPRSSRCSRSGQPSAGSPSTAHVSSTYVLFSEISCCALQLFRDQRRRELKSRGEGRKLQFSDNLKFPTEDIMGAQNFNFGSKFFHGFLAPNFVFGRKCSDRLKFRVGGNCPCPPPGHDVTVRELIGIRITYIYILRCIPYTIDLFDDDWHSMGD